MKTLSVLRCFTLHLLQTQLVNSSSTHPASVPIRTDKVNPRLGGSWCLRWENELESCWNSKSPLKAAIKFLTQGLRMFHCYTQIGKIHADFREVIRCLTFCYVSWKEEASFPSFTLQGSFWMPFAVQPTVAPYLISTCCFSSSEENRDSGRLHVFITSEIERLL